MFPEGPPVPGRDQAPGVECERQSHRPGSRGAATPAAEVEAKPTGDKCRSVSQLRNGGRGGAWLPGERRGHRDRPAEGWRAAEEEQRLGTDLARRRPRDAGVDSGCGDGVPASLKSHASFHRSRTRPPGIRASALSLPQAFPICLSFRSWQPVSWKALVPRDGSDGWRVNAQLGSCLIRIRGASCRSAKPLEVKEASGTPQQLQRLYSLPQSLGQILLPLPPHPLLLTRGRGGCPGKHTCPRPSHDTSWDPPFCPHDQLRSQLPVGTQSRVWTVV